MCGRFANGKSPDEIAAEFSITRIVLNLAPTQEVPVIRWNAEEKARRCDMLRWGLVPSWSKDASGAARMINARAASLVMHGELPIEELHH